MHTLPLSNIISQRSQLNWLVRMRWCAIGGFGALLVIAKSGLHLSLPIGSLWTVISLAALSNVGLEFWKTQKKDIGESLIGWILVLDILALSILLFLSGGPANPFSIFYIVHVCIAALLLGANWTWAMVVLSTVSFALLFKFHIVVPELSMHAHSLEGIFSAHLYGMLIAFALVSILVGYFLTRMTEALRTQEREIGDLRILASHHEKLASLTTLAAGAAHELNTPLGTIALVANELKLQLERSQSSVQMIDDAILISEEVSRCRDIIEKMGGHAGEIQGETLEILDEQKLISGICDELGEDVSQKFEVKGGGLQSYRAPKKALSQALATLIRNGIDACNPAAPVRLRIESMESFIRFTITDTGQGIPASVLKRIGEPFFTTKQPGKGMGLGVFLVKLFASRLGGSLRYESQVGVGTDAILEIPLQA